MATSPSPYHTDLSWLLSNRDDDQREMEAKIQLAIDQTWKEASEISRRVLQVAQPPGELWENAIKRTALDLRERPPGSVDPARSLLRYFELAVRKFRADQARLVQLPEYTEIEEPSNLEAAVVAKIDLKTMMHSLNPEEQDLILLRYADQGTWKELAALKGRSEGALKKQCARAIEKLRNRFSMHLSPK
jgi:hypothetical protein